MMNVELERSSGITAMVDARPPALKHADRTTSGAGTERTPSGEQRTVSPTLLGATRALDDGAGSLRELKVPA